MLVGSEQFRDSGIATDEIVTRNMIAPGTLCRGTPWVVDAFQISSSLDGNFDRLHVAVLTLDPLLCVDAALPFLVRVLDDKAIDWMDDAVAIRAELRSGHQFVVDGGSATLQAASLGIRTADRPLRVGHETRVRWQIVAACVIRSADRMTGDTTDAFIDRWSKPIQAFGSAVSGENQGRGMTAQTFLRVSTSHVFAQFSHTQESWRLADRIGRR